MRVYTIGFTKKSAADFFSAIRKSGVKRVVDVRLNNVSQLAGFSKRDDLRYFLSEICEVEYVQLPALAPTQEMLDAYKKRKGDWLTYERAFLDLMKERDIKETIQRDLINDSCLLCSEDKPEHCHRRLIAEYLCDQWGDIEIIHIS
ncbi:MAG: DUF488 domain-containing protein [Dehalococcoidia bacterium]|nr:DUF488 domain-containing protein [Dehalococcoidia bacterium]